MFKLSDSKMNLEFPSGQPLVSSPDKYRQAAVLLFYMVPDSSFLDTRRWT